MLLRRSLLVLIVLVSPVLLHGAETPIPPSPTQWVTDTANFMSLEAVRSLDARLAAYQQAKDDKDDREFDEGEARASCLFHSIVPFSGKARVLRRY